ncbi:MAG TPA: TetR/AcrR family transcriptional regulator [Solirubrobacterales bacterium]|jgi:AcrR family transcriptional regulator|nr:TetR/AcrR family transcriptional regulator [Solirubrobacterales bacterium]
MAPTEAGTQPTKRLFPRLSGGSGGMTPERVARHQKARLEGAMVEAVARDGYAATTLRELVAIAGVSKSTFYQHFESKQDCFLATFDEIVRRLQRQVEDAYDVDGDLRERLTAGLSTFMGLAVEQPAAASLAAVESLTLGAPGVEHREQASLAFEAMLKRTFDESDPAHAVSPLTVIAIMAGIRGTVYRNIRRGTPERLPELVGLLVEWALSYQRPEGETTSRAIAAAERPVDLPSLRPPRKDPTKPGWNEPPDSPRSRASLTQRERIVRGAAAVVIGGGYSALSIPAISRAAGVSNQTFYEHFDSKRDAFLASFEILVAEALAIGGAAFGAEGQHPEAIGAGLRALLEEIAANEPFARMAFFELPSAGPVALDRADAILDGFTAFLERGAAPGELGNPPPRPILEAIPTGIWTVLQRELAHGRGASLPELAPDLARLVLAPFDWVGDRAGARDHRASAPSG